MNRPIISIPGSQKTKIVQCSLYNVRLLHVVRPANAHYKDSFCSIDVATDQNQIFVIFDIGKNQQKKKQIP